MSGDPAETEKLYGEKYHIKAVEKFPAGIRSFFKGIFKNSATKKAVANCDYFILGGGGLFNDLSLKAGIIWGMQAFQALKMHKPLIIYGQSVGPLNDIGKFLVKKIFSRAKFIGVRDEDSATELKKLGINTEIIVTPDLAFRLEVNPGHQPEPTVIISLRQLESFTANTIKEFADFCNWLIEERKYSIKFIDFQQGGLGDLNLHAKIISQIRQKNSVIHLYKPLNSAELLEHFNNSDFVFAMRMHAIICAMKTCKPFLAISYSRKINSLIKDSGMEKYLISHEHIYAEQLKDFFIFLNDKKTEITEKLQKLNTSNLEKLKAAEEKLIL